MNWFLIALSAPALWAASSHIDKYLLQKYFNGNEGAALFIFATIADLLFLPGILFFHFHVLDIKFIHALILIGIGILEGIAFLLYYSALAKDEASVVTPIYQIIPVFAYILGYLLLGETLTFQQIAGSLLIIFGSIIISLDLSQSKMNFKTSILLVMLLSSLIFAFNGAIFKLVALEENYWLSNFWSLLGDMVMALVLFIFGSGYRKQFLAIFKINAPIILGINIFNEILTVAGGLVFRYATLLAPLALVAAVNGFQPFFLFVFGIALTLFFPRIAQENLSKKVIYQKILAIAIMFIGSYIINVY